MDTWRDLAIDAVAYNIERRLPEGDPLRKLVGRFRALLLENPEASADSVAESQESVFPLGDMVIQAGRDLKTCARCKEAKPIDNFGFMKAGKDGRNYYCRECVAAQSKAKYKQRQNGAESAPALEDVTV